MRRKKRRQILYRMEGKGEQEKSKSRELHFVGKIKERKERQVEEGRRKKGEDKKCRGIARGKEAEEGRKRRREGLESERKRKRK